MEHQIVAPRDGVVAAIRCSEGELVQPGSDLVELAES
jgi:biotin carboxyl carrier protein